MHECFVVNCFVVVVMGSGCMLAHRYRLPQQPNHRFCHRDAPSTSMGSFFPPSLSLSLLLPRSL